MDVYKHKVVVITGAGSGIGRELAVELARSGARLAISDINEERVKETAGLLGKDADVKTDILDVSSWEDFQQYGDAVVGHFGRVDYIFNNAGITLFATVENSSIADYERLLGINMWGMIYGTKVFLPVFRKQGSGHVINMSSTAGLVTTPTQSAYNVSKFAIRGFTECLAREMEGTGIKVSCIHPGGVATNIVKDQKFGEGAGELEKEKLSAFAEILSNLSASDAARSMLKGVAKGKRRILVGSDARIVDIIARLFPVFSGKIFAKKGL